MDYKVIPLDHGQIPAFVDHCLEVFQSRASRSYFESHIYDDPESLSNLSSILVVITETGSIVAGLRVLRRRQYFHSSIRVTSGLAEVSTKSSHRKRGLASSLIAAAISGPLQAGSLALFHTNFSKLGDFYGGHGFRSIPHQYARFQLSNRSPVANIATSGPCGAMVELDLSSNAIAHDAMTLYDTVCRQYNGPVCRDLAYFQTWVVNRLRRVESIRVRAVFGDRLLGYVFGNQIDDDQVEIEELIVSGNDYDVAIQLLSAVSTPGQYLRLPLPILLDLQLSDQGVCIEQDHGFMYRPMPRCDDVSWERYFNHPDRNVFWTTDSF